MNFQYTTTNVTNAGSDPRLFLNGTFKLDFGMDNKQEGVPTADDIFDVRLCLTLNDPSATTNAAVE